MGSVYFIQAQKHVKIGYSADVPRRLLELQTGSAYPLTLLAVVSNTTFSLEKRMHDALAPHRSHGEWFVLTGVVRRFIECIAAGAQPKTVRQIKALLEFGAVREASRRGGNLPDKVLQMAKRQGPADLTQEEAQMVSAAEQVITNPLSTPDELKKAHIKRRRVLAGVDSEKK